MDNYRSLGHTISIINRNSQIYLMNAFKDLDLHGAGQVRILIALSSEQEGISQEVLARILLVDKGTISRMISPLVKKGLVERRNNPADRRAYLLQLTEKALSLIPKIKERLAQWTEILSADMTLEEKKVLFSLLDRLMENGRMHIEGESFEE